MSMKEMWLLITRNVHHPGFVVAINTLFVIKAWYFHLPYKFALSTLKVKTLG